eukprot:jgi/Mesvir1/18218/Mv09497-RA.1
MASAIMQLHARGSQDIATIVNPEVTFWKTVYPRHTNFSWDDTIITQSTGTADYGQLVEFKLPRSGDLVTKCTLMVEMGTVKNWENNSAKTHYDGYWSFANPESTFGDNHLFSTANLVLNSQNVYGDGRDPVYFSSLLPSHFHNHAWDNRIYIIPFGLQPDSWKPTGSINLSRLDDVKLVLKRTGPLKPGCIHVYAKNFNVIKIQNGMGGKRYAS